MFHSNSTFSPKANCSRNRPEGKIPWKACKERARPLRSPRGRRDSTRAGTEGSAGLVPGKDKVSTCYTWTLQRWNHSRRKWTFPDASCFYGLPIYRVKGSLSSGRTPPDLSGQAAFHPVSRRPAQTKGVRKRLPFSLCIRPQVTPPL